MANKTQNAYVAGTNKARAGWEEQSITWDETDPETWDSSDPHDWEWSSGAPGFTDNGVNKTRNSKA